MWVSRTGLHPYLEAMKRYQSAREAVATQCTVYSWFALATQSERYCSIDVCGSCKSYTK